MPTKDEAPALDPRNDDDGSSLAGDLLIGAPAIARFIGRPLRPTYRLLEEGRLPAGKEGLSWIASKRVLRAYYAKITDGAS